MREGADMIRKVVIALGAVSVIVLAQPASAQNNTVGGALLGGGLGAIIGGAATGSAGGAVAGALIGGATGALIGSEADRRRSYYWWRGGCYQAVQGGYVRSPIVTVTRRGERRSGRGRQGAFGVPVARPAEFPSDVP